MLYQGKITTWHDDKGFGFVTQNGTTTKTFLHVSSLQRQGRRPVLGDIMTYTLGIDKNGRSCAEQIAFADEPRRATIAEITERNSASMKNVIIAIAIFAPLLVLAVITNRLPWQLLLVYVVMSVVTLLIYVFDKSDAQKNHRRTPESTLHLLSFACGWPGALFAQATIRHKSAKQEFRFVFWVTVILNCATAFWLCTYNGKLWWQSLI
jgi:uncharacterized membrane protein YsdA (DUF1294 family)/cold shock CspA family protein